MTEEVQTAPRASGSFLGIGVLVGLALAGILVILGRPAGFGVGFGIATGILGAMVIDRKEAHVKRIAAATLWLAMVAVTLYMGR